MKKDKKSDPKSNDGFNVSDYAALSNLHKKNINYDQNKDLPDYSDADFEDIAMSTEEAEKFKELKAIISKIENRPPDKFTIPKFGKKYKVDYIKSLNTEQLQAVVTTQGPLLIIAGAGTGKTRVLTYRTLFLIESGVAPEDILLLTFTKKAAKEMIGRVNKHRTDTSSSEVSGGTFHSLAFRLIREYNKYFSVNLSFSIANTGKSESIIDLAKSHYGFNQREKEFPKKGRIYEIISKSKNKQVSIEAIIKKYFTGLEDYIDDIIKINDWYDDYKEAVHLLDFDDMMIVLRDALQDDDEFRKKIQTKYKYIMVDEYQDTNVIQKDITNLMANDKQNLMVVGDDAQSIYDFRGANYENILRFPDTFPTCKIIKLNKNYRSKQKLIEFTNSVNNSFRIGYKKQLISTRSDKGNKPEVLKFFNQEDEAKFIVDTIYELHENEVEYCKMAVLCRSAWFRDVVKKELDKRNIPYVTVGGVKFNEEKHIVDIAAYLSVINHPNDIVAWHHILDHEIGVGPKTISKLATDLRSNNADINLLSDSHPAKVQRVIKLIQNASDDKKGLSEKMDLIVDYYSDSLLST